MFISVVNFTQNIEGIKLKIHVFISKLYLLTAGLHNQITFSLSLLKEMVKRKIKRATKNLINDVSCYKPKQNDIKTFLNVKCVLYIKTTILKNVWVFAQVFSSSDSFKIYEQPFVAGRRTFSYGVLT